MADNDYVHLDPTLSAPEPEAAVIDGRTWGKRTYVPPSLPEPIQRAIEVTASATIVPDNARKMARVANDCGWNVRITHARGYDVDNATGNAATERIMEPTGEFTDKGNARTKKTGSRQKAPVDSVRVVIRKGDQALVGHWVANSWSGGMILNGRTAVENINWTRMEKELKNAKSEADMRGEGGGQLTLSLTGD